MWPFARKKAHREETDPEMGFKDYIFTSLGDILEAKNDALQSYIAQYPCGLPTNETPQAVRAMNLIPSGRNFRPFAELIGRLC
jgi:hypothetical protein